MHEPPSTAATHKKGRQPPLPVRTRTETNLKRLTPRAITGNRSQLGRPATLPNEIRVSVPEALIGDTQRKSSTILGTGRRPGDIRAQNWHPKTWRKRKHGRNITKSEADHKKRKERRRVGMWASFGIVWSICDGVRDKDG